MPLLQVEAEKLSEDSKERGIIEEIIDHDDLFSVLPFKYVEGKSYSYVREKTLSEAGFISPVDQTVPEGAAEFDEVTTRLKIIAGQVRVDNFLNETQSDLNGQKAEQIALKAKGLGRKFRRTLVNGDTTVDANEFDGIQLLTSADRTIPAGANGAPLSYEQLDELLDAVDNGADIILMKRATLRAYQSLLRSAGGLEPAMVMMENFGRPMLTHNGVPILVDDFLSSTEVMGTNNETCSVYAMRLNEVDGLHGIWGGRNGGISVEDLGTHADYDATTVRLKWYASICLKSSASLASLKRHNQQLVSLDCLAFVT